MQQPSGKKMSGQRLYECLTAGITAHTKQWHYTVFTVSTPAIHLLSIRTAETLCQSHKNEKLNIIASLQPTIDSLLLAGCKTVLLYNIQ